MWNKRGPWLDVLRASSAGWLAKADFSVPELPVASLPDNKLVRLTSVMVGSAARPSSACTLPSRTHSVQPQRSGRSNSSRKMATLRPSTTSNSTG